MEPAFKISIPNPCSENWDNMPKSGNGRHCDVCDKVVVDFKAMSTQEIKEYFINQSGSKICGNFYTAQLEGDHGKFEVWLLNLYCSAHKNIKQHYLKVAAMFVIGGMLTLMGCGPASGGAEGKDYEKRKSDSIAAVMEANEQAQIEDSIARLDSAKVTSQK